MKESYRYLKSTVREYEMAHFVCFDDYMNMDDV